MDVTNRPSTPLNMEATIRVGTPQAAQAGASDITVRPGMTMQDSSDDDFRDGDFVLKGRLYRGIKCLSDNSGEAQVFLVQGDEGERVLKVYYPNFTIKKGLMRIIQNFNLEMIVKGIVENNTNTEGFCFCTDDKHIEDIESEGDIDHKLSWLVEHRDQLPQMARASRAFVEKHNAAPVVAQRYLDFWKNLF